MRGVALPACGIVTVFGRGCTQSSPTVLENTSALLAVDPGSLLSLAKR